jgi:hypothetical protein
MREKDDAHILTIWADAMTGSAFLRHSDVFATRAGNAETPFMYLARLQPSLRPLWRGDDGSYECL